MTTFGDRVFQSGGVPVGGDGLLGLIGDGIVLYVDAGGAGDDANLGRKPSQAVATLSRAQALATSNRGDVIIIMPGNYSHTAVLAITKDDLQFVAATGGGTKLHRTSVLVDANASLTTTPVIQITTANETAWYGIAFGSRSNGTGNDNVNGSAFAMGDGTTNSGQQNHMEGCYFPSHQASDSLLYMASGSRSSIVGNTFGGLATGPIHGITMTGSAGSSANIIIKDNIFKRLTNAIQLGDNTGNLSSMQDHLFIGNIFLNGLTTAFAADGAQAGTRCSVVNNRFFAASSADGTWSDGPSGDGRANAETDGYIFSGNSYKADAAA